MGDVIGSLGGVPTVVFRDISAAEGLPAGMRYALVVDVVGANLEVGNVAVSTTNPVPVSDTWEIITSSHVVATNDHLITVPAGYEYQMLWVWVEYTSDANAGNRQVEVSLLDATNDEIGSVLAGAVQAASLTRFYMFAPALADLGAFRDAAYLMTPFPPTVFLTVGQSVRVFDNNAISAADTMVIHAQIARRVA